jgi:hypothetical protein
MSLPIDLAKVVIAYFPLKKLQLWQEQQPSLFTNSFNNSLFYNRYNMPISSLTNHTDKVLSSFLSNFELFSYLAMNMGDIGYLGQFYLPLDVLVCYSILAKDLELLYYYLVRFLNVPNVSMLAKLGTEASDPMQIRVRIIYYLSYQYFPLCLPLLKTFSIFNFWDKPVNKASFYDLLVSIDVNEIERSINNFKLLNFPSVDIVEIWQGINNTGIITKSLVANANKLISLISTNFTKSDNVEDYINVLKILTNKDVDPEKFGLMVDATNASTSVVSKIFTFVSLALSVLNKPICYRIINLFHIFISYKTITLVSEVLYDISAYISTNLVDLANDNNIILSICLAKEQYHFITHNDIYNLINKDNQLNLYKIYNKISKYKTISVDDEKPHIYDAETALRLLRAVDAWTGKPVSVKRYLTPATHFSKNLMIKYDLLQN